MDPPTRINPDLNNERTKCTFDKSEFTNWWYGGADKVDQKRRIERLFLDDPKLQHPVPLYYLSHKERYEETMRTIYLTAEKIRKLQAEGHKGIDYETLFTDTKTGAAPFGNPLGMHYGMFVNMILGQGTEEQHAKWVERAKNLEIIGAYAQTEMGHGTFIRGLETTATFDAKTQEFVLHSPTPSSYKWWPGGLGQTTSHCIVMAQLITQGQPRGVFSFIVPLRDPSTYQPLKGITIGEIGPKMVDTMNNGFLGMNQVRIPRDYMLMRNGQVTEDGTFIKAAPNVLLYGTMTRLRVSLVNDMSSFLAKAATIAIRYSAVRRQSQINSSEKEVQILDHLTQQLKVFPQLAKSVVFKLAADHISRMHDEVTEELTNGQLTRLPEMHALSCCLKAITTGDASVGVETCRLACGGHGYLAASGFPTLSGFVFTARTFEGENTVMLLQTARFLVKSWKNAAAGRPLTPTVSYLANGIAKDEAPEFHSNSNSSSSIPGIIEAFQVSARKTLALACGEIERRKAAGMSQEEAVNSKSIDLVRAAELHCRAFLVQSGYVSIGKLAKELSPALGRVLGDLIELYAVDSALTSLDHLIRFVRISSGDVAKLQERMVQVLGRLRPNAVGIVDAFEFPDNDLSSALGAADGNVYERLLEDAMKSPLNQEPVNRSFGMYLKPMIMKSKM